MNLDYLPIGKLKKQCVKYIQAFGPGAVVFLNGFSEDLLAHMDLDPLQVLLLDAHPMDTTEIFGVENHSTMIHKEELVLFAMNNLLSV